MKRKYITSKIFFTKGTIDDFIVDNIDDIDDITNLTFNIMNPEPNSTIRKGRWAIVRAKIFGYPEILLYNLPDYSLNWPLEYNRARLVNNRNQWELRIKFDLTTESYSSSLFDEISLELANSYSKIFDYINGIKRDVAKDIKRQKRAGRQAIINNFRTYP